MQLDVISDRAAPLCLCKKFIDAVQEVASGCEDTTLYKVGHDPCEDIRKVGQPASQELPFCLQSHCPAFSSPHCQLNTSFRKSVSRCFTPKCTTTATHVGLEDKKKRKHSYTKADSIFSLISEADFPSFSSYATLKNTV